jgi:hypothetical protein
MQRQGGFAPFHQSAKRGRMVNLREKTRRIGIFCETGEAMPPAAKWFALRLRYDAHTHLHPCPAYGVGESQIHASDLTTASTIELK